MKQFNFIKSIPPKTQEDFNNWVKISAVLLIILFTLMAAISFIKIMKISKLKKEICLIKKNNEINDHTTTNNQIETTQSQDIDKQLKKLSRWKNPKIIPASIFSDISNAIPDDVSITEINYKYKQPILIKGRTKNVISLKNFTQRLKETEWAKLAQIVKVEDTENNLSNFELVIK